ncbi:finTRIM family, member 67 [Osmerus mordax]|uniref:finTRIM family, member 67 n=1 Tax=Osmerus mordax TaxID=8014 RepID=UPI00351046C1
MAQAGLLLDKDQFNCPICLDVLKDPVTIPCGHSYCSCCIKGYWDQDDYMGIYGCPQCRQTFNPRPLLGRNTMLADVVEKFLMTGLQSDPPTRSYAGPEDVECDVCTGSGRKNKAVKSCLVCLASYCETHLQPHYDSPAFKKHKLVVASKKLQDTICPRHDKLLEVYCRTDQKCICYLCLTDEHKGHDTVLAESEMHEKQTQLGEMQRNSQQQIQVREKELQELRQAITALTRSARTTVEESEKIFTDLIQSIELKRFELRELIRDQEKAAISQAEGLLAKLEQEIAELKRRHSDLEQLSHTDDHITFLQNCQSFRSSPGLGDLPPVNFDPNFTFGSVMTAVSEFKELLEEVYQGGFVNIYEKVRNVSIIESPKCNEEIGTETESTQITARPAEDQNTSCLNPFLSQVPVPNFGFAFSPFGSKLSSARQRPMQRRSHTRRK